MCGKVEIQTLIQPLPTGAPEVVLKADADLAALENDGWTRSMTTYSATFNHETHRVEYARMVELKRAVKADPLMAAVEEMLADMEARGEPKVEDAPADEPEPDVMYIDIPTRIEGETVRILAGEPVLEHQRPARPLSRREARRVVTGVVETPRKSIDEVSYLEALRSGQYTPEEMSEIGNREAKQAGLNVYFARQQARSGAVWDGLVMRLPERVPAQV